MLDQLTDKLSNEWHSPTDQKEAHKMKHKPPGTSYMKGSSILRCLHPFEVDYTLREVRKEIYGSHVKKKVLAYKLL